MSTAAPQKISVKNINYLTMKLDDRFFPPTSLQNNRRDTTANKLQDSQFPLRCQQILDLAGVEIDGPHPWDIQIHNDKFYSRVLGEGSLGLGESYMEGWWDCAALDQFFHRIFQVRLEEQARTWKDVLRVSVLLSRTRFRDGVIEGQDMKFQL